MAELVRRYLAGHGPADRFADVVPGGNGVFLPMLVADGEVVGTWKRARDGVVLTPFGELPGAADAAAAALAFRA